MVSSAQCSLNWDGNSTKSRGTFVPESDGYVTFENIPCNAWPNSWNIVVTSVNVKRAGWPAAGFVKFSVFVTTGFVPRSLLWPTKLLVQAPPALFGRENASR